MFSFKRAGVLQAADMSVLGSGKRCGLETQIFVEVVLQPWLVNKFTYLLPINLHRV